MSDGLEYGYPEPDLPFDPDSDSGSGCFSGCYGCFFYLVLCALVIMIVYKLCKIQG